MNLKRGEVITAKKEWPGQPTFVGKFLRWEENMAVVEDTGGNTKYIPKDRVIKINV